MHAVWIMFIAENGKNVPFYYAIIHYIEFSPLNISNLLLKK